MWMDSVRMKPGYLPSSTGPWPTAPSKVHTILQREISLHLTTCRERLHGDKDGLRVNFVIATD